MTPVTIDNWSIGHRQAVQSGLLEVGDVRDIVAEVMVGHEAASLLHFSALLLVGESSSRPLACYDNSVRGAISLAGAMRRCGAKVSTVGGRDPPRHVRGRRTRRAADSTMESMSLSVAIQTQLALLAP
jgi:hypothetical protein